MTATQAKLTYADYLETSDDERYELLNGELIEYPSPKEIHQSVLGDLYLIVAKFIRERSLGKVYFSPFDVVLSDTNVVQPDILFISNERADIITPDNVQGAPDMVVEILSPATVERDRTVKLDLYAQHGVKEYWMVDSVAKTVMVLVQGESGFEVSGIFGEGRTLRSSSLEGFSVEVEEVF